MCQKIQHQLPGGFLRLAPRLHVLHLAPSIVQEHGDINLPGNEYTLQCIPSVFVQGVRLQKCQYHTREPLQRPSPREHSTGPTPLPEVWNLDPHSF